MVSRILVRCRACSTVYALRLQRTGGTYRLVFFCPQCHVQVRALFFDKIEGELLESEDFDILAGDEPASLAVAVSPDVPVHRSAIGQPIHAVTVTPYIALVGAITNVVAADVVSRVEALRWGREELFPSFRRATSFMVRDDMAGVASALDPVLDVVPDLPADVLVAYRAVLNLLYRPLEDQAGAFAGVRSEFRDIVATAHARDAAALSGLFTEFDAGPLAAHSRRVLQCLDAAFDDVGSLFPGLWVTRMDGVVPLDEYRVMRDDFDTIKGRYQDIFELASRSLAFAASVANVAKRGAATAFIDSTRSLDKALNKTPAFDREPWLADFPLAGPLYAGMSRYTRNHIGHDLVRYEAFSGSVDFEGGGSISYLQFLVDYTHAVRVLHYVAEVALRLAPGARPS